MPLKYYSAPGLIAADLFDAAGLVSTNALLFYEGSHTPQSGRGKAYKKTDLEKIVQKTNGYLATGRRIKLYAGQVDHAINQQAAIGVLSGDLRLEEINEASLPLPGLSDLVGKWGIFANVMILDSGAVDQYQKGLLKELSIGLGNDGVIYEISAVSIPALAGAALFSATTLSDALAVQQMEGDMEDLLDAFKELIEFLDERIDSDQLKQQAIADLASQLQQTLGLTPAPSQNPQPLVSVPVFSEEPEMSEATPTPDLTQYQAQIDDLKGKLAQSQQQIELFTKQSALSNKFANLRQKAEALRAQGKLTPAEFNDTFNAAIPALEKFSVATEADAALTAFEGELSGIEFYLARLEKYAQPVTFGLPVEGPPLESESAEEFAAKFVEKNLPRISYR